MNTHVEFKVAKLLKEKGFDEITDNIYMTNHTTPVLFENINRLKHSDGNNPFISAPTIAEVIMWLYEKHRIWISVFSSDDIVLFSYKISCSKQGPFYGPNYNLPKEAYSEAITYVVKNLI